ncbi:MAG: formylglycine-generating enzyme family protein [Candidatus Delongbacteria bacterium]|nr:formylglycine-generating enzyme family protein [Candidatus Delongbacteria bacterium]
MKVKIIQLVVFLAVVLFFSCSNDPSSSPNEKPVINSLSTDHDIFYPLSKTKFTCIANDLEEDSLSYEWKVTRGVLTVSENSAVWEAPNSTGTDTLTVIVCDVENSVSKEVVINVVDPENNLVFVPSGSFNRGQIDVATPVHKVNIIREFLINKYEVTQKEWADVMGYPAGTTAGVGDNKPAYSVNWYGVLSYCNRISHAEGFEPCYTINNISDPDIWDADSTFADNAWDLVVCDFNKKGYRLPTTSEWEYAARYNDGRTYPWGDVEPTYTRAVWCTSSTKDVGSKSPSGDSQLGLSDMCGNVFEMCWDWRDSYTEEELTDPIGPVTGEYRTMKGGGWVSIVGPEKSAHNGVGYKDGFGNAGGFRVVKTR